MNIVSRNAVAAALSVFAVSPLFAITADQINKLSSKQVLALSDSQVSEYASISPEFSEKYFTVDKVEIVKYPEFKDKRGDGPFVPPGAPAPSTPVPPVPGTPSSDQPQPPSGDNSGGPTPSSTIDNINNGVAAADSIVNLASKLWDIVKANAPVATTTSTYATAVPAGLHEWTDLTGWSEPQTAQYSIVFKNGFGSKVVDFRFMMNYLCNGQLDGKGKYLSGVSIVPVNLSVSWSYKFNLTAEVPDSTVNNVGTKADPIAALQLVMKSDLSNGHSLTSKSAVFYVRGDCQMKEITGFASSYSKKPSELNSLKVLQ